jgi:hypothetical protein
MSLSPRAGADLATRWWRPDEKWRPVGRHQPARPHGRNARQIEGFRSGAVFEETRNGALGTRKKAPVFAISLGRNITPFINPADALIGMWDCRAAFPQKDKPNNVLQGRSLRLGATAFTRPKRFGAECWRVGVQPPEKFPFIPIFSHDLAVPLPCPSRAAGQPRSRAENRVSGQPNRPAIGHASVPSQQRSLVPASCLIIHRFKPCRALHIVTASDRSALMLVPAQQAPDAFTERAAEPDWSDRMDLTDLTRPPPFVKRPFRPARSSGPRPAQPTP